MLALPLNSTTESQCTFSEL